MNAYFTQDFIDEYLKLSKKKQYKDLENLILNFFLTNKFEIIATGDRLYGPNEMPYLKKRIPNSGGYRFYFLADFQKEIVFVNFVHPKTGPYGIPNVSSEFKKIIHTKILIDKQDRESLFLISRCLITKKILFEKVLL